MRVACRLPNSGTTWLRVAERTCVRLMPCENVCTCGLQDAHICRPFSHGILFVDSSMPSPAAVPHFVGLCCAPSVSARHITVSQILRAITRCRVEGCSWPWTTLHSTADNVAHDCGQRCTRPCATNTVLLAPLHSLAPFPSTLLRCMGEGSCVSGEIHFLHKIVLNVVQNVPKALLLQPSKDKGVPLPDVRRLRIYP